jgi:hypothetical protein
LADLGHVKPILRLALAFGAIFLVPETSRDPRAPDARRTRWRVVTPVPSLRRAAFVQHRCLKTAVEGEAPPLG